MSSTERFLLQSSPSFQSFPFKRFHIFLFKLLGLNVYYDNLISRFIRLRTSFLCRTYFQRPPLALSVQTLIADYDQCYISYLLWMIVFEKLPRKIRDCQRCRREGISRLSRKKKIALVSYLFLAKYMRLFLRTLPRQFCY